MKSIALTLALIVCSVSGGSAVDTGKELPSPVTAGQELDLTMQWLKSAIESITITLIPIDPEDGNQLYSEYRFEHTGCSVRFSYDFNYYQRMTKERKTTRIDSSFNLKDIGSPEAAPFYLTHIQTQLYSVVGNSFRIPVKEAGLAEQIAHRLDHARRLCGAATRKD